MISCQLAHLWHIWNYFFPTLILFATEILVAEYAKKKKNLICSYHTFIIQYMVLFHSLNPGKINWVIWETSNRNRNKNFLLTRYFYVWQNWVKEAASCHRYANFLSRKNCFSCNFVFISVVVVFFSNQNFYQRSF